MRVKFDLIVVMVVGLFRSPSVYGTTFHKLMNDMRF